MKLVVVLLSFLLSLYAQLVSSIDYVFEKGDEFVGEAQYNILDTGDPNLMCYVCEFEDASCMNLNTSSNRPVKCLDAYGEVQDSLNAYATFSYCGKERLANGRVRRSCLKNTINLKLDPKTNNSCVPYKINLFRRNYRGEFCVCVNNNGSAEACNSTPHYPHSLRNNLKFYTILISLHLFTLI